jgi:hypothetical protein
MGNVTTVIAIVAIFVGLPLLIVGVTDRVAGALRHRHRSPETRGAQRQAFEQRILQPDWRCVERHLQRPVPQKLRELYANSSLITAQDVPYAVTQTISTFEPLDERAISTTKSRLGFEAVIIATTDFGDSVYLPPGSDTPDIVYITYHDGGDTDVFAKTIAAMVETLTQGVRHGAT